MEKSPFSFSHSWNFERSSEKSESRKSGISPFRNMEAERLKMIGEVGVIGSVQAKRLFGWNGKKLRQLVEERKLIQHTLQKNRNMIPVYTLSPQVAKILHTSVRELNTDEVVRKIIVFQFLCAMSAKGKKFHIHRSVEPYTLIQIKEQQRHLIVLSMDQHELRESIAESTVPVIVIAETLKQVEPMNNFLKDVRLLLHADLHENYRFYHFSEGKWTQKTLM